MSKTRTRIKICGITNIEDARAAIDYGADTLGFIWVPGSPRFVGSFPGAENVPDKLPPFVSCVAVCYTLEDVPNETSHRFNTIQHYAPTVVQIPGKRYIQAFRIRNEESLNEIAAAIAVHRPSALHLDTYHKDLLGGSGEVFDWTIAIKAKARFDLPIILAGGLSPENVAGAVAAVGPYAVDVSSGVEAEPGRKDHAKLKAFIQAVRDAERAN